MTLKKKRYAWAGFLGVIVTAFLIGAFTIPDIASGKTSKWSRKNPKRPGYWRWDKSYWPTKPVRGGYLRTASTKYIGLMNPNHWPCYDWVTLSDFYDRGVLVDGSLRATVPWLVESWKFINPTTAILKLRKGVKFHDGSDFDAASYKYHFEWIMDKKSGAWPRTLLEPVKSIKVVDKYTMKWRFKRPWAGFVGNLEWVPGWAISAKALKGDVALKEIGKLERKLKTEKKKLAKYERKGKASKVEKTRKKIALLEKDIEKVEADAKGAKPLDQNPVGAGRYMLEDARPGNYYRIKRNPNWWFAKYIGEPEMPYLDGKLITVIPDPMVQLANFRAGKIDSLGVDVSQYKLLKNDPKFNVHVSPSYHIMYFAFNQAKGSPCNDIRVRKAISHAIDRKALIRATQFGLATEASCLYPDFHWAHNPKLKPVRYDPELSKKLLAKAGYSKGLALKGDVFNSTNARSIGEVVQRMLSKVGINWKFEALDMAAQDGRVRKLEYDLRASWFLWIKEPDSQVTSAYHPDGPGNYGRNKNKKVISLILKGRKEVNPGKRQKLYWKIEETIYKNYEDAWMFWPMQIVAYHKNVQGYNHKMYVEGREAYHFSHTLWFKDGKP